MMLVLHTQRAAAEEDLDLMAHDLIAATQHTVRTLDVHRTNGDVHGPGAIYLRHPGQNRRLRRCYLGFSKNKMSEAELIVLCAELRTKEKLHTLRLDVFHNPPLMWRSGGVGAALAPLLWMRGLTDLSVRMGGGGQWDRRFELDRFFAQPPLGGGWSQLRRLVVSVYRGPVHGDHGVVVDTVAAHLPRLRFFELDLEIQSRDMDHTEWAAEASRLLRLSATRCPELVEVVLRFPGVKAAVLVARFLLSDGGGGGGHSLPSIHARAVTGSRGRRSVPRRTAIAHRVRQSGYPPRPTAPWWHRAWLRRDPMWGWRF